MQHESTQIAQSNKSDVSQNIQTVDRQESPATENSPKVSSVNNSVIVETMIASTEQESSLCKRPGSWSFVIQKSSYVENYSFYKNFSTYESGHTIKCLNGEGRDEISSLPSVLTCK